ncbi:MAG: BamA/TamA family outer membrane protein [Candidatus Coatesbacteria bacterium]|nr:MAG: BamA/TamA family outer membrane protein [Candidatus Coatesbacteria bacterium]
MPSRLTASLTLLVLLASPAAALKWAGVPYAYYTSDTGPAVGAYAAFYFRLPDSLPETRDSYIQPLAIYTWKRQFRFDLNGDLYSPTADWRLRSRNRYEKYPTEFWPPPGSENVPKEYYAKYTREKFRAEAEGYRRLLGALYAGLGAYAEHYEVVEWAPEAEGLPEGYLPGPAYAPGAAGGLVVGPTAFVEYDTRDLRHATTSGLFVRGRFSLFDEGAGSDYTFRWYEADARFFWSVERLGRKWTCANRLWLSGRDEAPPFWAMPELGGSAVLRGEPEGRSRGRWLVAYQEELRVPLFWRVLGALFVDVGDTARTVGDFSADTVMLTAGGGLRLDLLEGGESRVRFDYGRGKDSQGFYLVFSEAF